MLCVTHCTKCSSSNSQCVCRCPELRCFAVPEVFFIFPSFFSVFHHRPVFRDIRGVPQQAGKSVTAFLHPLPHLRCLQICHQSVSAENIIPDLHGEFCRRLVCYLRSITKLNSNLHHQSTGNASCLGNDHQLLFAFPIITSQVHAFSSNLEYFPKTFSREKLCRDISWKIP